MRHSGFWIAPVLQEVQHGKAFDTPAAVREALGRHAAHSGCRRGMYGASAPLSPGGTIPTGGDEPSDSAVSSTEPAASSVPEPEPEPVVETLRFSATGDDLIHSPIYKQAARRAANGQQYDFDYCYAQVAPFYAQQDINWINQETLCSDELEPSSYPCFSTPGDCAGRFTGPASGCSACQITTPTIRRSRSGCHPAFLGEHAGGRSHHRPVAWCG